MKAVSVGIRKSLGFRVDMAKMIILNDSQVAQRQRFAIARAEGIEITNTLLSEERAA